jgi:hypothetical protein
MVMLLNARLRVVTTDEVVRYDGVVDDLNDHFTVFVHLGPIRLYLLSWQGDGDDITVLGADDGSSAPCAVTVSPCALAGAAAQSATSAPKTMAVRLDPFIEFPLLSPPSRLCSRVPARRARSTRHID